MSIAPLALIMTNSRNDALEIATLDVTSLDNIHGGIAGRAQPDGSILTRKGEVWRFSNEFGAWANMGNPSKFDD